MTAAVRTKGDHLAVEQGGVDVERREARGETRHSRCPVVPVPGYQSSLAVVEPDEQAIAVELDFRDPVVPGRRPVGVGGELRGEPGRQAAERRARRRRWRRRLGTTARLGAGEGL